MKCPSTQDILSMLTDLSRRVPGIIYTLTVIPNENSEFKPYGVRAVETDWKVFRRSVHNGHAVLGRIKNAHFLGIFLRPEHAIKVFKEGQVVAPRRLSDVDGHRAPFQLEIQGNKFFLIFFNKFILKNRTIGFVHFVIGSRRINCLWSDLKPSAMKPIKHRYRHYKIVEPSQFLPTCQGLQCVFASALQT